MRKLKSGGTVAFSRALILLGVVAFCGRVTMEAVAQDAQESREAGEIALKSLSPQVRIWSPHRTASAVTLQASSVPGDKLDLPSEASVTYNVPAGARSLSGVATLVKATANSSVVDAHSLNRVRLRFLVDGNPGIDLWFDRDSPPQAFSLPLNGAQQVELQNESVFEAATVTLSPVTFSMQPATAARTHHVLEPGKAQVDVAPQPRQKAVGVYYAGEAVPVTLDPGSGGLQEVVSITLRTVSQSGIAPVTFTSQSSQPGAARVGTWTVPQTLGPATLDVSVRGSGQALYSASRRIAIVQPLDEGSPTNPNLGVHISSSGYPLLQDQFASLWGAHWARLFVRWENIERNQGQFDFSGPDALMKVYSAQPLKVLMVLGESAPAWAGGKAAPRPEAFGKFVEAVVRRYQGRVSAWDVYNEIDSKKISSADAALLVQQGISAIRRNAPSSAIICCSLGGSGWLAYNAALRDAGVFRSVTAPSMHPYMKFAPERSDGLYNYLGLIDALRSATGVGRNGAVWSSEANWLPGVGNTDKSITEHVQAEYVVRMNLLSIAAGVPYFVHMPYFYNAHPQLFSDNFAAYHAMARLFSNAQNVTLRMPASNVFAVIAQSGADSIGAVWTPSSRPGTVRFGGSSPIRFFDFYGNPRSSSPGTVAISGEPVYFRTSGGSAPSIAVVQPPGVTASRALPNLSGWKQNPKSTYTPKPDGGMAIVNPLATYNHQLQSPLLTVQPRTCYVLRAKLNLIAGGVVFAALDAADKNLASPLLVAAQPQPVEHEIETRFQSDDQGQVSILFASGNSNGAAPSEFSVSAPEIAPCD